MPPILVTRPTLPPFEEYTALISKIWENRWLTNSGPLHQQLAGELKKYLNISNISLFTNGHSALEVAVHCTHLPKGSEVITTPYTFASTTHAIVRNGCKPVFCDISYDDYNIDTTKIEELITDNTSAILPVHVYGTPCHVDEITRIAKKHDLKVIYDAAHAFGVEIAGRSVSSFGDATMLSFHATKVFNTIEGGAVISPDKRITDAADQFKNFGMEGNDDYIDVGTNAKMSEFQAAMGVANLKYVDQNIGIRKILCDRYTELLQGVEGVRVLARPKNVKSNYAYYPILIEEEYELTRDQVCDKLAENEIYARKYFYPIVTEYSCYKGKSGFPNDSVAKDVSMKVICLPLYDTMDVSIVDKISALLAH
ncbi:DegT/DnrJ/EryC1/StrS family aminotransferase [Methanocorpusculum bavaricum]|uniref:DegT/DnrJ/EryC1/StrS family aminotransferase n=1 Tax=Methanocorpusculum bavaricum TaxID=71518 RepID=UPI0005B25AD7|nr:DegT/DnrJ/EryC1/StrS family aminotransferase [Methanocorpusculum bavaricum]